MIQVNRTETPRILEQRSAAWLANYLTAIRNYSTNNSAENKRRKEAAEKKYQHNQIKEALASLMFHGKCAYCESQILHIDYGHIEHFKPKSLFPKQIFDWLNLLLACGKCNGKEHKGDKFPMIDSDALLVNPCTDNPDEHFLFEYDENTSFANVIGKTPKGQTTEIELGLNRPQLLKKRSFFVENILFIALKLKENPSDITARSILDKAEISSAEYSSFTKAIRKRIGV
jgi:uncharacterized protein (TIGR02646 family)